MPKNQTPWPHEGLENLDVALEVEKYKLKPQGENKGTLHSCTPCLEQIRSGHKYKEGEDVASESKEEGVPIAQLVDQIVWVVGDSPRHPVTPVVPGSQPNVSPAGPCLVPQKVGVICLQLHTYSGAKHNGGHL